MCVCVRERERERERDHSIRWMEFFFFLVATNNPWHSHKETVIQTQKAPAGLPKVDDNLISSLSLIDNQSYRVGA